VELYELYESNVRSYCRSYNVEFNKAQGAKLYDVKGKSYLDFLAGCGSLNYGHNHPILKEALLKYIREDGVAMSLDMHSSAKSQFIESFKTHVLGPRKLDYRIQFPGPTGTNAVEAAIKLARKITRRTNIVAFTNGFHGCSLGALSLTANSHHRSSSTALLNNVTRIPYDGYLDSDLDSSKLLQAMLDDPSSGVDKPAAIIFECIQGEGGLNTASKEWAQSIEKIAREHNILLIVDEIQSGCGRSGHFFSFEALDIKPDIITLAKSLSGYGLPLALVLIKPDFDQWEPGEHNGTFRGNNHAFVTGAYSFIAFWQDQRFEIQLHENIRKVDGFLAKIATKYNLRSKGRGMMQGINLEDEKLSLSVKKHCFEHGVIVETSGSRDEILKIFPPLNISNQEIEDGFEIINSAIEASLCLPAASMEQITGIA